MKRSNKKWNNLLTPLRPRSPVTSINRSFREGSMKHVEPQHQRHQLGYAHELLLVAAFFQFVGGSLSESWESNLLPPFQKTSYPRNSKTNYQ